MTSIWVISLGHLEEAGIYIYIHGIAVLAMMMWDDRFDRRCFIYIHVSINIYTHTYIYIQSIYIYTHLEPSEDPCFDWRERAFICLAYKWYKTFLGLNDTNCLLDVYIL